MTSFSLSRGWFLLQHNIKNCGCRRVGDNKRRWDTFLHEASENAGSKGSAFQEKIAAGCLIEKVFLNL